MSRIHDALRRAEQMLEGPGDAALVVRPDAGGAVERAGADEVNPAPTAIMRPETGGMQIDARAFLARCRTIPFQPAPETHLIHPDSPTEGAAEEFRALRTRLNHMQSQAAQDLRVIVLTSASPAEGKTFVACNLALAQAQLESPVLLADLDLRRPVVHQMFQCERSPGFSDFLLGQNSLEECIRRVEGTNLYLLPAGSSVRNPLELLNMRPVRLTLDSFRKVFGWVILDTPPLLFSADGNLLATITDGIVLVVRIGSTTYDSIVRAIQSLCENNVLGIVANGARAGELYSKYTYYYTRADEDVAPAEFDDEEDEDEDSGGESAEARQNEYEAEERAAAEAGEVAPTGEAADVTSVGDAPAPDGEAAATVEAAEPAPAAEILAESPEPVPAPPAESGPAPVFESAPEEAAPAPAKRGFFGFGSKSPKPPKAAKFEPEPEPVKPSKSKKAKPPVEEDEDDGW